MPAFVDTNILVYAEDRDAKRKHDRARELLLALWDGRDGVVSIQVLQEFYVTVTRKLKQPLLAARAQQIIDEYLTWTVVENSGVLLRRSIELQRKAKLSFWDALIVQAALDAGCDRLYSEDLSAGQLFGSLRIINPFASA